MGNGEILQMPEFKLEDVQHATYNALRNIGKTVELVENPFTKFQLYKLKRKELLKAGMRGNFHGAINNILQEGINKLHSQDDLGANILDLRFSKGETIVKVGHVLNLSADQISRRQRQAIASLSKIIWAKEKELRQLEKSRITNLLPAKSYSKIFGQGRLVSKIINQLRKEGRPNIIFIVGLGGIGKSTLADYVVRKIIGEIQLEEVFWIRPQNYRLNNPSALATLAVESLTLEIAKHIFHKEIPPIDYPLELRKYLASARCIIVIDNLDSEMNLAKFVSQLLIFSPHTKIIITARARVSGFSKIYYANVNELSLHAATSLMVHQANSIGLMNLGEEISNRSKHLYNITGGNPLAIKLAIGMLEILPLREVLHSLKRITIGTIEDLYHGIYSISWKTLSSDAKKLLRAMPLTGEAGATIRHLHKITEMTKGEIINSLQELSNRSLVEYRGTLESKRYGIHKLTETFLRNEILK